MCHLNSEMLTLLEGLFYNGYFPFLETSDFT